MDYPKHCEILDNCHCSSARILELDVRRFQQDNDPKHTSKQATECSRTHFISVIEWPRQSPNFSPIEIVWKQLKVKVGERRPFNLKQLEEACFEEWGKIPADVCRNLVSSYKRRLEVVLANKGHATKW